MSTTSLATTKDNKELSLNINARAFAPVVTYRCYSFPPSASSIQQHNQKGTSTPLSYYFENNTTAAATSAANQQQHLQQTTLNRTQFETESKRLCAQLFDANQQQQQQQQPRAATQVNQKKSASSAPASDLPRGFIFSKENWLEGGGVSGSNLPLINTAFQRVLALPGIVFSLPAQQQQQVSSAASAAAMLAHEWEALFPLLTDAVYNFVALGFFVCRKQPFIFAVMTPPSTAMKKSQDQQQQQSQQQPHHHHLPINTSPFMEAMATGSRAVFVPEGILPLIVAHNTFRPRSVCVALVSEHEARISPTTSLLTTGKPGKNDSPSELLDAIIRNPDHGSVVGPTGLRLLPLTATVDDVSASLVCTSSFGGLAEGAAPCCSSSSSSADEPRVGPIVKPEDRTKPHAQFVIGQLPCYTLAAAPVQRPFEFARTCLIVEIVVPQLGASSPSPTNGAAGAVSATENNSPSPSASSSSSSPASLATAAPSKYTKYSSHYKLQTQPVHEAVRHALELLAACACSPTVVFDIRMRQRIPIFEHIQTVFLRTHLQAGAMDMWSYASGVVHRDVASTYLNQAKSLLLSLVLSSQQQQQQQQQQEEEERGAGDKQHDDTNEATLKRFEAAEAGSGFHFDNLQDTVALLQQQLNVIYKNNNNNNIGGNSSGGVNQQQPQQQIELAIAAAANMLRLSCAITLRVKNPASMTLGAGIDLEWFKVESLQEHVSLWRLINRAICDSSSFAGSAADRGHELQSSSFETSPQPPERLLFPPSHRHRLTASRFSECVHLFAHDPSRFLVRRYACGPRVFLIVRNSDFFVADATMRLILRLPIATWNSPTTRPTFTAPHSVCVVECTLSPTIRPEQMKLVAHDVLIWDSEVVSTKLDYLDRMELLHGYIEHEERYALPSIQPVVIVRTESAVLHEAVSDLLMVPDFGKQCAVDYDYRGLCIFATEPLKEPFEAPLTYVWVPPESTSCVFAISDVLAVQQSEDPATGAVTTKTAPADLLPPGRKSSHTRDGILQGASSRLCRVMIYTAPATPALSRHAPSTVAFHGEYTEFYEDEILSERLVSSDLVVALLQRDAHGSHWWEIMRTLKAGDLADVAYSPFSLLGAALRHGVVEGSSGFSHPAMASYHSGAVVAALGGAPPVTTTNNASPTTIVPHQAQEQDPASASDDGTTTTTTTPTTTTTSGSDVGASVTHPDGASANGPVVTPITICSLTPRAEVENTISDPMLSVAELAFTMEAAAYRCKECGVVDDRGRPDLHPDDIEKSKFLCSSCWMFKKGQGDCMACGEATTDGDSDIVLFPPSASASASASASSSAATANAPLSSPPASDANGNTNSKVDYNRARFFCKKCWKTRYEVKPSITQQAADPITWLPTLLCSCLPPSVNSFVTLSGADDHGTQSGNSATTMLMISPASAAAGVAISSTSSMSRSSPVNVANANSVSNNKRTAASGGDVFKQHSQREVLRACVKVAKRKQCIDIATSANCKIVCELLPRKDEPTISFWSDVACSAVEAAACDSSYNNNNNNNSNINNTNNHNDSAGMLYMISSEAEEDDEDIVNYCSRFDHDCGGGAFEYRLIPGGKNVLSDRTFWREEIALTVDDWSVDFKPKDFANVSVFLSNQPDHLQRFIMKQVAATAGRRSNNTDVVDSLLEQLFCNIARALAPGGVFSFAVIDPNSTLSNGFASDSLSSPLFEWVDGSEKETSSSTSTASFSSTSTSHATTSSCPPLRHFVVKSIIEGEQTQDQHQRNCESRRRVKEAGEVDSDDDDDDGDGDGDDDVDGETAKCNEPPPPQQDVSCPRSVASGDVEESSPLLFISHAQIKQAANSHNKHQKFFRLLACQSYMDLVKACLGDNLTLEAPSEQQHQQQQESCANSTHEHNATPAPTNPSPTIFHNTSSNNNSNNNSNKPSAPKLPSLLYPTVYLPLRVQAFLKSVVVYRFQRCGRDEERIATERHQPQQQPQQQQQRVKKSGYSSSSSTSINSTTTSAGPIATTEIAAAVPTAGKYVPPSKRPTTTVVTPAATTSKNSNNNNNNTNNHNHNHNNNNRGKDNKGFASNNKKSYHS